MGAGDQEHHGNGVKGQATDHSIKLAVHRVGIKKPSFISLHGMGHSGKDLETKEGRSLWAFPYSTNHMERISNIINRCSEIVLCSIISIMAVVVFAEVIFRYALLLPLFWTEEFARYCLVWSSLLGAGVALKRGEHIAVTFFLDKLPKKVRSGASLFARISIFALLGVIFWGGLYLVLLTRHQLSPAMRVSMSWPYMAVPLGSLIMLFHELTFIYMELKEMIGKGRCAYRVIGR